MDIKPLTLGDSHVTEYLTQSHHRPRGSRGPGRSPARIERQLRPGLRLRRWRHALRRARRHGRPSRNCLPHHQPALHPRSFCWPHRPHSPDLPAQPPPSDLVQPPASHHHWILRAGHWVDVDDASVADVTPAPTTAVTPGPCTCLTKTYTPAGLVVFADICTKESASAPAADDAADASQAPSTPVRSQVHPDRGSADGAELRRQDLRRVSGGQSAECQSPGIHPGPPAELKTRQN